MSRLQGKVTLIVDGDAGLGRAAALAFAAEGAHVVVGGRRNGAAAEVAGVIGERGQSARAVVLDPTDPVSCEQAVADAHAVHGRLDVLCNTAIRSPERKVALHELSEAEWDATFAAGVTAVALPTRFALRVMKPQKSGVIIVIGSSAAQVGVPNVAAFSAAAGVLTNWMRSIALDGTQHGIRANLLSLGSTWDSIVPSLREQHAAAPVAAEEIVPLLVFLASDDSRQINSQILGADDGLTAWRQG